MNNKNPRHLINFLKWSDSEIQNLLTLAMEIKDNPLDFDTHLKNQTLVMLFQKTSTRTRVSFEAGMTELGGHAIFLDWNTTNFNLTPIGYEAAYLSTNCSIIMARMKNYDELLEMSQMSQVPVINGCCNRYHPCQAMADMLTILTDRGTTQRAKLTYIGVHNNVANSLTAVCAALGVQLTLVCPISPEETVDQILKNRIKEKGLLRETLDLDSAVKDADYIYTDTWIDMEFFNDPTMEKMKEERIKLMLPFQINQALKDKTKAKIMHDMPIHPGYEITKEMVTHKDSVIFEQSGNRLPVQKAIMLTLLGNV